jgi:hypothetical protein
MTNTKNAAHQTAGQKQPQEGYGAGEKSKANPGPSSMPSSKQTDTAKPIGKGKASNKTDRS